ARGNPRRAPRRAHRRSYAGSTLCELLDARARRRSTRRAPEISMPRFNIPAEDAQGPLGVGIDIGSGGTRAGVSDRPRRQGGQLNHKETHSFTVDDDGTSTIDADQIVEEIRASLAAVLTTSPLPGQVRAIGFDTFASTLVAVDAAGNALTPCI